MNELQTVKTDSSWEDIMPHLDAALGSLNEPDRNVLLLRYFKNQDLRSVGATLGISDDAAQKRVSRAGERLREFLAQRGVPVGAGGLAVVISAHAVQAAPVGLALTISTAAALAGSTLATTATAAATKTILMTTLQKTLIAATLAVVVGAGVYEARRASRWQEQNQTLQQQQATMAEQLQRLENEKEDTFKQLTSARNRLQDTTGDPNELLRLRAEITRLRREATDLAEATKGALAFQAGVLQVLSNTPPVRTFVASTATSVPWNQTVVLGGWKTPNGKRAIILTTIKRGDNSQEVGIDSQVIEYSETAGATLGLSNFNAGEARRGRPDILNSEQTADLMKLTKTSEGVSLGSIQRVTTASGRQAQIMTVDMHQTPSGEEYSTGPVLDVVPTVSADGQSVQVVMTARLNYLIPFPMP